MTPEEIRMLLLRFLWYEQTFSATGCVALNPFHKYFTLGMSAKWHDAGWVREERLHLWIYPTHETLEETLKGIYND